MLAERHLHARAKSKAASQAAPQGSVREGAAQPAREEERAALVRRVKSGGAREGDLLRYLELSGVGE